MILYKELYYRDIYARVPGGPKPEQRFHSFYNYCDLFNYILSAETPVPLELPDQWLWELIDEFVYQFQSFAQYRSVFWTFMLIISVFSLKVYKMFIVYLTISTDTRITPFKFEI